MDYKDYRYKFYVFVYVIFGANLIAYVWTYSGLAVIVYTRKFNSSRQFVTNIMFFPTKNIIL